MTQPWQSSLERWLDAGLIDSATAERIQAYKGSHQQPGQLRCPVLIAVGFGALLLGAGVLLFVASHPDELSPSERFPLALLLVAGFHVAGALATNRFPALATAGHGIGTIATGAGIFLSGPDLQSARAWARRHHAVGYCCAAGMVVAARLGTGRTGSDNDARLVGGGMD